jgi:uncharacterized membrane-anchored protein YitT (DUF2179 family)
MKKAKKIFFDYSCIVVGTFILAFAIAVFLNKVELSTGGVSGIATVLNNLPIKIPLWATTLSINVVLFVLGFKMLPKSSILKTVVGIALFSGFLAITEWLADTVLKGFIDKLASDIWVCSIFGGVLVGVGVGLVVLRDASTGGSDFAALMLHKVMPHISVGTFIMIIDTSIIILSGLVLGFNGAENSFMIIFYSIVSLFISNKITDLILVGGDRGRSVYIVTKKSDEIAQRVMNELERGVTAIHSRGCYEGYEGEMLMCIVRTKEVPKILAIVREVDPSAFTVISEVKEVRGLGFKEE